MGSSTLMALKELLSPRHLRVGSFTTTSGFLLHAKPQTCKNDGFDRCIPTSGRFEGPASAVLCQDLLISTAYTYRTLYRREVA